MRTLTEIPVGHARVRRVVQNVDANDLLLLLVVNEGWTFASSKDVGGGRHCLLLRVVVHDHEITFAGRLFDSLFDFSINYKTQVHF